MDFATKNNFIVANAGAQHFEKDMELFKQTFPDSSLIPQLQKANQFNKKQLDERMLLEMLGPVSPDAILVNRGAKAKPAAKKKSTRKRKPSAKKATATKASKETPQKKSGGQGKNTQA